MKVVRLLPNFSRCRILVTCRSRIGCGYRLSATCSRDLLPHSIFITGEKKCIALLRCLHTREIRGRLYVGKSMALPLRRKCARNGAGLFLRHLDTVRLLETSSPAVLRRWYFVKIIGAHVSR